jgi:exosortase
MGNTWDATLINLGILATSAYALYERRREIGRPCKPVACTGILAAARGLCRLRPLLFPMGFPLLCVVNYWLCGRSQDLIAIAATLAGEILNGLGVPVLREGASLAFGTPEAGFAFRVEGECSGLRSLTATMAVAAGYGYFTLPSFWRKWAFFLASIPIALLANALRVAALCLFALRFGQEAAMSLFHDAAGWLVYVLSIAALSRLASRLAPPGRATGGQDYRATG